MIKKLENTLIDTKAIAWAKKDNWRWVDDETKEESMHSQLINITLHSGEKIVIWYRHDDNEGNSAEDRRDKERSFIVDKNRGFPNLFDALVKMCLLHFKLRLSHKF